MQVSTVQNYFQNYTNYNTGKPQTKNVCANVVSFSGKPNLEPNKFSKKLNEIVDFIKSTIKGIKDKKAAKAQAIIDAESKIKAEEEARRLAIQKRRETINLEYKKRVEADKKLKKEADRIRTEEYTNSSARELAKEYYLLMKQNDITWASKVKQILKDKGYGLLDGKAVKEYTQEAFRPLKILPFDNIANSSFIPKFAQNPPLVKNPSIVQAPVRGKYSLANISVYNQGYTQKGFGQVRFPESKFGANTGLNIPGKDRDWTMGHTYRPDFLDYDKTYYCTTLSYRHVENRYGDAPGFSFIIEGDLRSDDLNNIRNFFIDNGYMKRIIEAEGNKEASTEIFKEMSEIIVKYLNGAIPN